MISVLVALCLAASSPGDESSSERQARLIRHELEELKLALENPEARAQLLTPEENLQLSQLDADLRRYTVKWPKVAMIVAGSVFVTSAAVAVVFTIYELAHSLFCFSGGCGSLFGVGGWLPLGLVVVGALVTFIVASVEDARLRKLAAPVKNQRDLLLMQVAGRHLQNPQQVSPPPVFSL
jgi:hypothetical protein